MESDRRKHQNKKAKEVQQKLINIFGVDKKDVYGMWLAYVNQVARGFSEKDILDRIKNCKDIPKDVIDYFTALGLIMVTKIMSGEV